MHCASLGEFEQGRPLIEAIRKKHPQYKIVLTFFSPSGFEASKNYAHAEVISYLPLDTKQNARDFMSIVKPHMAIFIKYEFWINFLNALKVLKRLLIWCRPFLKIIIRSLNGMGRYL
ncbi:MAG: hypothetical protein IPJ60_12125 [Sphingobacteriaceae bacterium]|nr:hypothetical protein [Sphingobacteriaceae bacterium]